MILNALPVRLNSVFNYGVTSNVRRVWLVGSYIVKVRVKAIILIPGLSPDSLNSVEVWAKLNELWLSFIISFLHKVWCSQATRTADLLYIVPKTWNKPRFGNHSINNELIVWPVLIIITFKRLITPSQAQEEMSTIKRKGPIPKLGHSGRELTINNSGNCSAILASSGL